MDRAESERFMMGSETQNVVPDDRRAPEGSTIWKKTCEGGRPARER